MNNLPSNYVASTKSYGNIWITPQKIWKKCVLNPGSTFGLHLFIKKNVFIKPISKQIITYLEKVASFKFTLYLKYNSSKSASHVNYHILTHCHYISPTPSLLVCHLFLCMYYCLSENHLENTRVSKLKHIMLWQRK